MDRSELGRLGEELAARHLVRRGWKILDRNFRSGHKELDLVVRRGPVLAFVEVKTRRGADFGHPLEGITRAKRREVQACARSWLRLRDAGETLVRRFDAVSVRWGEDGRLRIEHVEDAWRVGE